jgi:hypothetical protein
LVVVPAADRAFPHAEHGYIYYTWEKCTRQQLFFLALGQWLKVGNFIYLKQSDAEKTAARAPACMCKLVTHMIT